MDQTNIESFKHQLLEYLKSPYLDSQFSEQFDTGKKGYLMFIKLQLEYFNAEDTGISSRILNHWKMSGLFPVVRKGMQNRFSFLELFWLQIVKELREFGLAIEKIRKVKYYLFSPNIIDDKPYDEFYYQKFYDDTGRVDSFNYLGYAIIQTIMLKEDMNIYINKEGQCYVLPVSNIHNPSYSYITISLMRMLIEFISDIRNLENAQGVGLISEKEKEILNIIRRGEYRELLISFKDREPIKIIGSKEITVEKGHRLEELIVKGGYQNIQVKTRKGEIVYAKIDTTIIL